MTTTLLAAWSIAAGCTHHVYVSKEMTLECAPEHYMPQYPEAQPVRFKFVEDPSYGMKFPGRDSTNGLEATRYIRKLSPASKILFLSEDRGSELIEVAFQVGGFGYILKSDSHSDLLIGIRTVLRGLQFVSRSLADRCKILD